MPILTGQDITRLMRRHHVTIRQLAGRIHATRVRIREIRAQGIDNHHVARDWIEAITGIDPGALVPNQRFDIDLLLEQTIERGQIRLGCIFCDRTDFDGVDSLPDDWDEIDEVRSYAEAIREVAINDLEHSVLGWETHLGTCPECQTLEAEER